MRGEFFNWDILFGILSKPFACMFLTCQEDARCLSALWLLFASEIGCGGYQGHLLSENSALWFWSCRVGICPPHAADLAVSAVLHEGENACTAWCRLLFWLLVTFIRNSKGIPSPVYVLSIPKPTQFHTQISLVLAQMMGMSWWLWEKAIVQIS